MIKRKEDYINEVLNFYKKEWMDTDKSLLIEQCYDLGFTTKKQITKLGLKSKEEIVEMLLKEDKKTLEDMTLEEVKEEYNSFSKTLLY